MTYHPAKLVCLSSKGGVWYVQVTMPKELQSKNTKQVRRSTGTTDRKEAERRQHRITEDIYRSFDDKMVRLNPQPLPKFTYATEPTTGPIDPFVMRRMLPPLEKKDAKLLCSRVVKRYVAERTWEREKTRKEIAKFLHEFISVAGDIQVNEIKKKHAYMFAGHLEGQGFSNSTISSRVRAVGKMLTWCEQVGLIEDHKFRNLTLSDYGRHTRPYKALTNVELQRLFCVQMPPQDKLCLGLLAVTGARLDEIALLTWEQIRTSGQIRYIDLTDSKTKNRGSKRFIPVHKEFVLPQRGDGRLFTYSVGQDEKAQNAASKALMPHIRKAVGEDDRKVVHSLRGTLKDKLRDAGVSKEINDFFTGHSSGDVAGSYGSGPSLETRFDAINSVNIRFLGPELSSSAQNT